MDAYDISVKIRNLWAENYDKNSGQMFKGDSGMPVYVDGKRIVDVVYTDGKIELKVKE